MNTSEHCYPSATDLQYSIDLSSAFELEAVEGIIASLAKSAPPIGHRLNTSLDRVDRKLVDICQHDVGVLTEGLCIALREALRLDVECLSFGELFGLEKVDPIVSVINEICQAVGVDIDAGDVSDAGDDENDMEADPQPGFALDRDMQTMWPFCNEQCVSEEVSPQFDPGVKRLTVQLEWMEEPASGIVFAPADDDCMESYQLFATALELARDWALRYTSIINDGGRREAGSTAIDDCFIRALAVVLHTVEEKTSCPGDAYRRVWSHVESSLGKEPTSSVSYAECEKVLEELGFVRRDNVVLGIVLGRLKYTSTRIGHVVAVVNGDFVDEVPIRAMDHKRGWAAPHTRLDIR